MYLLLTLLKIKLKKGETKQTLKEVKSLPQGHTGCRAEPEFRLEMVEPDGPPGLLLGMAEGHVVKATRLMLKTGSFHYQMLLKFELNSEC